jgi:hypothetical protein
MGVVMGVTAVILGIAAGLVGLILWTALIFSQTTARAREALEARPGRCFGIGIALTLLLGVPALGLIHAPHGLVKLAGWALALPLVAGLVTGLAAMAELLGERLRALSPALTPLGGLVRGVVTVELAALIPFVGWLLFAPLVGLTVTGAGALGCLRRAGNLKQPQRHRGHRDGGKIEHDSSGELEGRERAPVVSSLLDVLCVSGVPFLR